MTDFVVGFLRETLSDRVLLMRKNRPAWQNGLLNGPGGKVEPGETPYAAMVREWEEETGFRHDDWRLIASLTDIRDPYAGGGTVHFYASELRLLPNISQLNRRRTSDDGPLEDVLISELPFRRDLVATVRWMVFMAFEDSTAPPVAASALENPLVWRAGQSA